MKSLRFLTLLKVVCREFQALKNVENAQLNFKTIILATFLLVSTVFLSKTRLTSMEIFEAELIRSNDNRCSGNSDYEASKVSLMLKCLFLIKKVQLNTEKLKIVFKLSFISSFRSMHTRIFLYLQHPVLHGGRQQGPLDGARTKIVLTFSGCSQLFFLLQDVDLFSFSQDFGCLHDFCLHDDPQALASILRQQQSLVVHFALGFDFLQQQFLVGHDGFGGGQQEQDLDEQDDFDDKQDFAAGLGPLEQGRQFESDRNKGILDQVNLRAN
jgi:hypothetical protein